MQLSPTSPQRRCRKYGQAVLNVAKAPRWRALILTSILLLITCWTWRASHGNISAARLPSWNKSASSGLQDQSAAKPATLQISNITIDLESGEHKTVPARLKKENPQFHLLIHAPKINAGVCRCLLSSYILNYPPPTLVGYEPPANQPEGQTIIPTPRNSTNDQNGIPDVSHYLKTQRKIKDQDAVLLVDGESTLFQLPSEVLLSAFTEESARHNRELARKYPPVTLQTPHEPQSVQRFNQSVLFASSNQRSGGESSNERSYSIFGLPTQAVAKAAQEPSVNDAAIMGSAHSLRRLFKSASVSNNQFVRPDLTTFRTLQAQQSRVRDATFHPQQQRRSVWRIWKLWLSARLSVDRAVRFEQDKESRAAAVRDLGIGVDETSKLVYAVPPVDVKEQTQDEAGLEETIATEQKQRLGIVKSADESGVRIPGVLRASKDVQGPFGMHPSHLHMNVTAPPASSARARRSTDEDFEEDEFWMEPALPSDDTAWSQIPLVLNPNTGSVAPVISTSSSTSTPETNEATNTLIYENLWFHPYARSLLNQYLLRGQSKEVASEAAVGGERWWDSRGGRGGVWTVDGEWIDAGELCGEFGADLFVDGEDYWVDEEEVLPVVVVPAAAAAAAAAPVAQPAPAEDASASAATAEGREDEEQDVNGEETVESTASPSSASLTSEPSTQSPETPPQEQTQQAESASPSWPLSSSSPPPPPPSSSSSPASVSPSTPVEDETNDVPIAIMADGTKKALSEVSKA